MCISGVLYITIPGFPAYTCEYSHESPWSIVSLLICVPVHKITTFTTTYKIKSRLIKFKQIAKTNANIQFAIQQIN